MSEQIDAKHPAVGIQFSVGLSALGENAAEIRQALTQTENTLSLRTDIIPEKKVWVGACPVPLLKSVPEPLKPIETRNLRFALTALQQIENGLRAYTAQFDPKRLAIVIGTSTSGIAENEVELQRHFQGDQTVQVMQKKQEMDSLAKALQQYLAWEGVAYTISTACSSSAKAFAAGQRLINAGLADAVLVGGVDTLCKLTLNGFDSLESLSNGICQPCGQQRDGINIGEAAALFLLSKESAPVMLISVGESMDAWHISAPHPEGVGAAKAMQAALEMANIQAQEIGYLNLHGTATPQNDAMEIKAVQQVFEEYRVPLSSTKHKTGHCLGAAGAIEAMICTQVLQDQTWLPLHQQTVFDAEMDEQNFVENAKITEKIQYVISNSFAFGGSNMSLIFGTQLP